MRLGQEIPKPRIKWTKEGELGEKYPFLSWGRSRTCVNVEEHLDSIFNLEFKMKILESVCKKKEKISRRHTVGLHIVTSSFGVIQDFGELFSS